MGSPTQQFRHLLREPGIVVQPAVAQPLAARVAEEVGFEAIAIGGYAMGASQAISEPLLCLEDVARVTRDISRLTRIPIMVDAGAGWGEPLHVMHTVRTLEQAGAASIHVEDQSYPKRAHYHKGVETVVPVEDMVAKVRCAVAAKTDPDFAICARTDAMRTHGYAEGIRRARAYVEAGADLIMLFPNNTEETMSAPQDLPGVPLVYVNSTGNTFGRGVFPADKLAEWGWKVVYDAISVTNVTAAAIRDLLTTLRTTGDSHLERERVVAVRQELERTIGLDRLYDIEEATVGRRE